MGAFRRFLDHQARHFESGGRLARLQPLWEALDSFFYTSGRVTRGSVHLRDGLDTGGGGPAGAGNPRYLGAGHGGTAAQQFLSGLEAGELLEGEDLAAVASALPRGANLFVASSMPIR